MEHVMLMILKLILLKFKIIHGNKNQITDHNHS